MVVGHGALFPSPLETTWRWELGDHRGDKEKYIYGNLTAYSRIKEKTVKAHSTFPQNNKASVLEYQNRKFEQKNTIIYAHPKNLLAQVRSHRTFYKNHKFLF